MRKLYAEFLQGLRSSWPLWAIIAFFLGFAFFSQMCRGEEPEPNSVTALAFASKNDLLIGRNEGLESYDVSDGQTRQVLGDSRKVVALTTSYQGIVPRVIGITKINVEGASGMYEIFDTNAQPLLWSIKSFEFAPLSAIALSDDGRLAVSILEKLQSRILVFDHDEKGRVQQCTASEYFGGPQPNQLFWEDGGSLVAVFKNCKSKRFESDLKLVDSYSEAKLVINSGQRCLDFSLLLKDQQLKSKNGDQEKSNGQLPHHFVAKDGFVSFLIGCQARVYNESGNLALWTSFEKGDEATASAFSPDGELFTVGSKSGKVQVIKTHPKLDGHDRLRKE